MKNFLLFAMIKHWFSDGVFRRIFKNAGLMLTGRAANGVMGLITLSIMARGLGAEVFGIVVLVQTYVLVISGLTTFQSWQALIRYGAISLKSEDPCEFQNLLKFTMVLDVIGIVIGLAVGYLAAPLIGPFLKWNSDVVVYAQAYSFLTLFTVIATPIGVLRLFDRFDLLTFQASIAPLCRMIGVSIALALDAPLWGYLVAWFVAGGVGGIALIVLGWLEVSRRGRLVNMSWSFRGLSRGRKISPENKRKKSFAGDITNREQGQACPTAERTTTQDKSRERMPMCLRPEAREFGIDRLIEHFRWLGECGGNIFRDFIQACRRRPCNKSNQEHRHVPGHELQ